MCRAPFRDRGRSKRDYLTSTSALWGFAPNPLLGVSRRARARQFADMSSAALSRSLCLGIAAPRATTNAGHRPASPRRGKVHGEGETPAGGGKPSAYPPSDSESRSDALAGVQICRQANLSENRRARFGQLRCPRLARSAGSSANHAKRIGRTQPRRARGGASALDNLGTICAQLPTGAGESPFASRFRVA